MIIKLHESTLFTVDPAIRFGKEYDVSPKVWNEMWKRYGLYEYDFAGLCGYFQYMTDKKLSHKVIKRWIMRTEIYCRATHVMRMGVRVVDSSYFGAFEADLIKELTRNMRYSGKLDSRVIV